MLPVAGATVCVYNLKHCTLKMLLVSDNDLVVVARLSLLDCVVDT